METIYGFIIIFALIGIYFLPSIVASSKKHRNTTAITILNLFLGWTLIFWVIALSWATVRGKDA